MAGRRLLDFRFGGKKFKIEIDSSIWREEETAGRRVGEMAGNHNIHTYVRCKTMTSSTIHLELLDNIHYHTLYLILIRSSSSSGRITCMHPRSAILLSRRLQHPR